MGINRRILSLVGCGILSGFMMSPASAQAPREIPRVVVPQLQAPIVIVPTTPSLRPSLPKSNVPVIQVPSGAVMLVPSPPPVPATASDLSCDVVQTRCANSACFPLGDKWSSYRHCLVNECQLEQQNCIDALVQNLRERARSSP